MMRRGGVLVLALALLAALPAGARAQGDSGRRAIQGGGRAGRALGPAERQRLQRQIRQAYTRAVRNQVGLNDAQMRQLVPINRKYAFRRQQLVLQERSTRLALREQLSAARPNQDSVAKLSDQLQGFTRQRLDLNAEEDRELGGIMSPVQLARFHALRERVQRQLERMRPNLGGGAGADLVPPDSSGEGPGAGK